MNQYIKDTCFTLVQMLPLILMMILKLLLFSGAFDLKAFDLKALKPVIDCRLKLVLIHYCKDDCE